jgi:HTH-type transcriptional regulator/antitoxin HigA
VSDEDAIWLKKLPIKELIERGSLTETSSAGELRDQVLAFFGVASRESWEAVWLSPQASFRQSPAFQTDPAATAAWLRLGELGVAELAVSEFERGLFQQALLEIRSIMVEPPERFEPKMRRLCAESGVALVIVDEIKGSRANGAARWMAPMKAMIQLSLRGRWEDMFWFTFFHEAGHILLHGKRSAFVDGGTRDGVDEDEADAFAARHLIPVADEPDLLRIRTLDEARRFALRLGIPPAVVVGRLQREGLLPHGVGNRLRRRLHPASTT